MPTPAAASTTESDEHARRCPASSARWNGSRVAHEHRVEDVEHRGVDRDRDRDAEHGRRSSPISASPSRASAATCRPAAHRGERAEDDQVAVAEGERRARGGGRAARPTASRSTSTSSRTSRPTPATASSAASTVQPASPWTTRVERGDRAEDDLAERDDHQQAVALGDVVRVPRRAAPGARRRTGPTSSSAISSAEQRERRRRPAGRRARAATQPTCATPIVTMYVRAAGAALGVVARRPATTGTRARRA